MKPPSDLLFEDLAVIPKPVSCLFRRWCMRPYDIPESRRMISLDQVGEFMHDDVIDDENRRLDQPPIKVHVVLYGTRTPPKATIHNFRASTVHP